MWPKKDASAAGGRSSTKSQVHSAASPYLRVVGKLYRLHDGKHSADDFRKLSAAIVSALETQLEEFSGPDDADKFDRGAIEQVFRDAGFDPEDWGLDPTAELPQWLAHIEEVHEDLDIYVVLYERYPSGVIDSDELISLDEVIKDLGLGPDD